MTASAAASRPPRASRRAFQAAETRALIVAVAARLFAEQGYVLSSVVEVDQEASMRSLVSMGVGLCLLREDVAREAERQQQLVVWHGASRPCPLSFVHLKARVDDALVIALYTVVLEQWAQAAPAAP